MNIISGKPPLMPRLPLISGIVVMLVFAVLVGLNVHPRFLGAGLNSIDFGHCHIARGWPAFMVFESHRFTVAEVDWHQDDNGVPLEVTKLALKHRFSDANPMKGYFGYSGLGIATNTLVGLAILVATIFLCGRYLGKFLPRVEQKAPPADVS